MYFKNFQKISYTDGKLGDVELTNINVRVSFTDLTKETATNFFPYRQADEDRYDIMSDMYYGDRRDYWIAMLSNEHSDMWYDIALKESVFEKYLLDKYTDDAVAAGQPNTLAGVYAYTQGTVKFYKDVDGDVIDKATYDTLALTDRSTESIYDWETRLNDDKREVKFVSNDYTRKLNRDLKQILNDRRES